MTGPHDLGGKEGFGPVIPEENEPAFHHDWERKAFGLTLAMGGTGQWNIDMSRQARERIPPQDYLSFSYYEIWLEALTTLLMEKGLVSENELASGHAEPSIGPKLEALKAGEIKAALARGGPADRAPVAPAKFQVDDRVKTGEPRATGHTRLPAYIAGKTGRITRIYGTHVFPDKSADGETDAATWLYNVEFDAQTVWGRDHAGTDTVMLDLWEPYLERV